MNPPESQEHNVVTVPTISNTCAYIYNFVDGRYLNSFYSNCFTCFLTATIMLGLIATFLESLSGFRHAPKICSNPVCNNDPELCPDQMICEPVQLHAFTLIDRIVIYIFTLEFAVKLLTCWAVSPRDLEIVSSDDNNEPVCPIWLKYLYYIFNIKNILDIATFLPYWFGIFLQSPITSGTTFLRVLRLLRAIRVLGLFKASTHLQLFLRIFEVILKTLEKSFIAMIASSVLVFLMVIFYGCLIYVFESGTFMVTPEFPRGEYLRLKPNQAVLEVSPFVSIPTSFYWVITTMCTVGYGDLVPTSWVGRAVACCTMFSGIMMMSLPIGVVGSHFVDLYQKSISDTWRELGENLHIKDMSHDDMVSIFNTLDVDGDGMIDVNELKYAFESMGIVRSANEFVKLLDVVDSSRDGTIDIDEFIAFCYKLQGRTQPQTFVIDSESMKRIWSAQQEQELATRENHEKSMEVEDEKLDDDRKIDQPQNLQISEKTNLNQQDASATAVGTANSLSFTAEVLLSEYESVVSSYGTLVRDFGGMLLQPNRWISTHPAGPRPALSGAKMSGDNDYAEFKQISSGEMLGQGGLGWAAHTGAEDRIWTKDEKLVAAHRKLAFVKDRVLKMRRDMNDVWAELEDLAEAAAAVSAAASSSSAS